MRLFLALFAFVLIAGCSSNNKPRSVDVIGNGEVKVYPDYAEVTIEVNFTKDKMKDAVYEVQTVVNEVMAASAKYTDRKNISTSNITSGKDFEYRNDRQVFTGYYSTQELTVKITDLKKLDFFMEEMFALRITSISNITYSHTRSDSLQRLADLKAVDNAMKTVDKMCSAYDAKNSRILEIKNFVPDVEGSNGRNFDRGRYHLNAIHMNMESKAFGGPGVNISPSQITFNSECFLSVEIE